VEIVVLTKKEIKNYRSFSCTKTQQATRFIEHCENYKSNHVESHHIAKQVQKLIWF